MRKPKPRPDKTNLPQITRPPRHPEEPAALRHKIENTAEATRRHLVDLVSSPSLLAAMAHVCSPTQKMDWATGSAPGDVVQWDRKTWSHENYFTAVGVSVDPGNHVLSIILLAIRHALGMEPLLEARACSKDLRDAAPRRPVGWPAEDGHRCDRHPLLAGATAAGISRKEGYMKPVSSLIGKGASPQAGVPPLGTRQSRS